MKSKIGALIVVSALGATVLTSGCATQIGAEKLKLSYSASSLEVQIKQAGLLGAFEAYWQAYVDRDWARRYSLEKFQTPVDEAFYAGYYGNGFPLKSVEVTVVEIDGSKASLVIGTSFDNPKRPKDYVLHQRDEWILVDGSWRHVVADPLIKGQ